MKKIKVYMRIDANEKIDCICLRKNKGCDSTKCERDMVWYDQYQHIKECMVHSEGVKLNG